MKEKKIRKKMIILLKVLAAFKIIYNFFFPKKSIYFKKIAFISLFVNIAIKYMYFARMKIHSQWNVKMMNLFKVLAAFIKTFANMGKTYQCKTDLTN